MRQLILIAALVLASASAQAAGMRGLTLASSDDQTPSTVDAPTTVDDGKAVETPKYIDRPAAVNAATAAPASDAGKPAVVPAPKAARRKPRRDWTEARIIGELHRHGIYW